MIRDATDDAPEMADDDQETEAAERTPLAVYVICGIGLSFCALFALAHTAGWIG